MCNINDVSYALSISSIARKTHVDNIMSLCYIYVDQKRTPRNDGLSDHVYPSVCIEPSD